MSEIFKVFTQETRSTKDGGLYQATVDLRAFDTEDDVARFVMESAEHYEKYKRYTVACWDVEQRKILWTAPVNMWFTRYSLRLAKTLLTPNSKQVLVLEALYMAQLSPDAQVDLWPCSGRFQEEDALAAALEWIPYETLQQHTVKLHDAQTHQTVWNQRADKWLDDYKLKNPTWDQNDKAPSLWRVSHMLQREVRFLGNRKQVYDYLVKWRQPRNLNVCVIRGSGVTRVTSAIIPGDEWLTLYGQAQPPQEKPEPQAAPEEDGEWVEGETGLDYDEWVASQPWPDDATHATMDTYGGCCWWEGEPTLDTAFKYAFYGWHGNLRERCYDPAAPFRGVAWQESLRTRPEDDDAAP